MKTRSRAFTLIELLTVIAIVGILAAIIIPALGRVRDKANGSKAVSNIRQIGVAALLYAGDHKGDIPGHGKDTDAEAVTAYLEGRLFPYIENREVVDWRDLEKTYGRLVDPLVPLENRKNAYYTHAFKNHFEQAPQGSETKRRPAKKLASFEDPGELLYAVTGGVKFWNGSGSNPTALTLPENTWRWGIYFVHDGATPGVFLDGHAEMLPYPIGREYIDPNYDPPN